MVYFRELPVPLAETDDDFWDFFFKFANTYTEESILYGYLKDKEKEDSDVPDEVLRELGYSDKDLLAMGGR